MLHVATFVATNRGQYLERHFSRSKTREKKNYSLNIHSLKTWFSFFFTTHNRMDKSIEVVTQKIIEDVNAFVSEKDQEIERLQEELNNMVIMNTTLIKLNDKLIELLEEANKLIEEEEV